MVNTTPIYDLPREGFGDEPGGTLNGGQHGDVPILAEAVEDELERVDGDTVDLQDQIDEINSRGWHDLTPPGGTTIDSITTFTIPSSQYDMIRVNLRGSLTDDGYIGLRVNNDSTSDLHRRSWVVWRGDNGAIDHNGADNGTSWRLAQWGTASANVATALIYRTHLNSFLSMTGGGYKATASTTTRTITQAGGSIGATRLLTGIQVRNVIVGSLISTCDVWIEGHRRPI